MKPRLALATALLLAAAQARAEPCDFGACSGNVPQARQEAQESPAAARPRRPVKIWHRASAQNFKPAPRFKRKARTSPTLARALPLERVADAHLPALLTPVVAWPVRGAERVLVLDGPLPVIPVRTINYTRPPEYSARPPETPAKSGDAASLMYLGAAVAGIAGLILFVLVAIRRQNIASTRLQAAPRRPPIRLDLKGRTDELARRTTSTARRLAAAAHIRIDRARIAIREHRLANVPRRRPEQLLDGLVAFERPPGDSRQRRDPAVRAVQINAGGHTALGSWAVKLRAQGPA